MKNGKLFRLLILALAVSTPALWAQPASLGREVLVLSQRGAPPSARSASGARGTLDTTATKASYSVEFSQVARIQGLAFYRTAVDITNNTTRGGVVASIQYAYANPACANGFCRTPEFAIQLGSLDNFHSDDMVQYMDSQGLLVAGAVNNVVGTLLITFDSLPSSIGWEGTATARLYARLNENDPSQGTVGYAFPASLFFESAHETTVATIRDTTDPPQSDNPQGSQRTNIGVRNTDINGTRLPVSAVATFYDVTPGSPTEHQQVGNPINFSNLIPGEVVLAGNVFTQAAIPINVTAAICFVDVASPTPSGGSPTIESFAIVIDNATQDGSYFEMKCADTGFTCGQ